MSNDLVTAYLTLEEINRIYNQTQKAFYQAKYKYWSELHSIKEYTPLKQTYAQYSSRIRAHLKKQNRLGKYGKKPRRGYHMDHFYYPVLLGYCLGLDETIINHPFNIQWTKKQINLLKGIQVANENDAGYDQLKKDHLDRLIQESNTK